MANRKVRVLYEHFYNQTVYGAPMSITIGLDKNDYDLTSIHPKETRTYTLAADGNLADTNGVREGLLDLWCNAAGNTGSRYEVVDPDGFVWYFVLSAADLTEISLMQLRLQNASTDSPPSAGGTLTGFTYPAGLASLTTLPLDADVDDLRSVVKAIIQQLSAPGGTITSFTYPTALASLMALPLDADVDDLRSVIKALMQQLGATGI